MSRLPLATARALVASGWGQWKDNVSHISNCVLQANNQAAMSTDKPKETAAQLNTAILGGMTLHEKQLAHDWWSSNDPTARGEWRKDYVAPDKFYPIGFNNHPRTNRRMVVDLFDRAIRRDEVDRLCSS